MKLFITKKSRHLLYGLSKAGIQSVFEKCKHNQVKIINDKAVQKAIKELKL